MLIDLLQNTTMLVVIVVYHKNFQYHRYNLLFVDHFYQIHIFLMDFEYNLMEIIVLYYEINDVFFLLHLDGLNYIVLVHHILNNSHDHNNLGYVVVNFILFVIIDIFVRHHTLHQLNCIWYQMEVLMKWLCVLLSILRLSTK